MLCLRRPKADIIADCRDLQDRLRGFIEELESRIGPIVAREPPVGSNEFYFQSMLGRPDPALMSALRDARRSYRRICKQFTILIDISLASDSRDEYQRAHRPIGFVVGSTPAANYDILLREVENTIDQIEYFKMEVEAAENVVSETDAERIDIGILVPLQEEFDIFRSEVPIDEFVRKNQRFYYRCKIPYGDGDSHRCVATLIGDMGTTNAAVVASEFLRFFQPDVMVMLGIAASVSSDLLLGDVVVASGVDDYVASSKAVEGDDSMLLHAGGPIYRPTPAYVELARNFKYISSDQHALWQQNAAKWLTENSKTSIEERKVREQPELHVEVVASGSFVSASKTFNRWLREHRNRQIKSVEMESSGLMSAISQFRDIKGLVIRGISDHADDEKASLEAQYQGIFRRYAMRNAVTFFKTFVQVPAFWESDQI